MIILYHKLLIWAHCFLRNSLIYFHIPAPSNDKDILTWVCREQVKNSSVGINNYLPNLFTSAFVYGLLSAVSLASPFPIFSSDCLCLILYFGLVFLVQPCKLASHTIFHRQLLASLSLGGATTNAQLLFVEYTNK